MNLRHSLAAVAGALMLSGVFLAPASAATTQVGTVAVSVTVNDVGGPLSVGLSGSSSGAFGTVNVDAVGTGNGVKPAGQRINTSNHRRHEALQCEWL